VGFGKKRSRINNVTIKIVADSTSDPAKKSNRRGDRTCCTEIDPGIGTGVASSG
jgi:hypothetical protein